MYGKILQTALTNGVSSKYHQNMLPLLLLNFAFDINSMRQRHARFDKNGLAVASSQGACKIEIGLFWANWMTRNFALLKHGFRYEELFMLMSNARDVARNKRGLRESMCMLLLRKNEQERLSSLIHGGDGLLRFECKVVKDAQLTTTYTQTQILHSGLLFRSCLDDFINDSKGNSFRSAHVLVSYDVFLAEVIAFLSM